MPRSSNNAFAFATALILERQGAIALTEVSRPSADQGFRFRHIPELDGFRGLAVVLVVLGHYLEYHSQSHGVQHFALCIARLGVLLFFVLSGFLITGLLCRERSLTTSIDFKAFYVRRILRLAPALLLFLSAIVLLMRLGLITDIPKKELLECLLYSRNIVGRSLSLGHIWSLSLEEQFYLLWPLTFLLLPRKHGSLIIAGICLAFMIWRGVAIAVDLFPYDQGIYYVRPYFRFDSILIGSGLALWITQSDRALACARRLTKICSGVVLWMALALWTIVGESVSRPLHTTLLEILVAAVLAHLLLSPNNWIVASFRHPWLRFAGTISYSLYLWQEIFVTANSPSWGAVRRFPLALLMPVAIAIASYFLLERPILRLKHRWAPHAKPID